MLPMSNGDLGCCSGILSFVNAFDGLGGGKRIELKYLEQDGNRFYEAKAKRGAKDLLCVSLGTSWHPAIIVHQSIVTTDN